MGHERTFQNPGNQQRRTPHRYNQVRRRNETAGISRGVIVPNGRHAFLRAQASQAPPEDPGPCASRSFEDACHR
eukprot:scaffold2224_cov261-Pinguiococcus_pyrenoidosus.AAC.30